MDIKLDRELIYDIAEAAIRDYDTNKDRYSIASDKKMAVYKFYSYGQPNPITQEYKFGQLTIGVLKNRFHIYVIFTNKDHYPHEKQSTARYSMFMSGQLKRRHKAIKEGIRRIKWEIENKEHLKAQERASQEFLEGVRAGVPGMLDNAEKILINGDQK